MKFRKLYFRGGYGLRNFGDDLLYVGICRWITANGLEDASCFDCFDADYLSALAPFYRHAPSRSAQGGDLILHAGGTQFYSFPLQHGPRDRSRRLLQALRYEFSLIAARLRRRGHSNEASIHQGAVGIGAGPFFSPRTKRETARLFREFEFLWTRDEITSRFAHRWGARGSRQGADIVYWIAEELRATAPDGLPPPQSIGFIPRFWPHTKSGGRHFASMLASAEQLRRDGREVEFMFLSGLKDTNESHQAKQSGFNTHVWDPDGMSVSEFLGVFRRMKTIVTARYHGAIVSAILGVPFICCDIEPKLNEVMTKSLGPEVRVWRPPYAHETLCSLLEQDGGAALLASAIDAEIARAHAMFADLTRFVSA